MFCVTFRATRQQKPIPEAPEGRASKTRTPQVTPAKASPKVSATKPKASPKASSKKAVKSPPERVTRNRKNTTSEGNTKKRRSSLVISKKAPVMSPNADTNVKTCQVSPKKRATRAKKEQKVVTPKRTRVRAQRATVVVLKSSPKLKPQAKGKDSQTDVKLQQTRKNTAVQVESPKELQPRKTRGKQNAKVNKTDNDLSEKSKRGRKIVAFVIEPPVIVTKRGRGKETSVQEVKTRGKSVSKADENQPKTRGKKVEKQESVLSEPITRRGRKQTENVSLQTKAKTGGRKADPTPVEHELRTRGKKVETQSSVQSEPVTRGRKTKVVDNTVIPVTRGRKRKTVAFEEVPPKVAKTETRRGRKAADTEEPVKATRTAAKDTAKTRASQGISKTRATQDTAKTRAAQDKASTSNQEGKTRGRPKKDVVEVEKPAPTKATRGRKVSYIRRPILVNSLNDTKRSSLIITIF